MSVILVTGATGFVGSHLVEAGAELGLTLRTLVRPNTHACHLQSRPHVEVVRGDITDPVAVRAAVEGVDAVIHCAAKIGDWGPTEDYRAVNVEGLRHLLESCRGRGLRSFIHLSSLGVYAARHHHGTDETEPVAENHIDGYTQTKAEAERLALAYHREHRVPVTILRPGFIYGPRDRVVLPRLVEKLRLGRVRYLGGRDKAMNTIFVGNLVDAIFAALKTPAAVGQIYNLTDGETVSKCRFVEAIADGMGVRKPPRFSVPLWMVSWLAGWMEGRARRRQAPKPPRLTQAMIKFLGLNLDFSIDKARRELGYQPRYSFDEAIRLTTEWFREQDAMEKSSAVKETAAAS